jgi:hypothetical protein
MYFYFFRMRFTVLESVFIFVVLVLLLMAVLGYGSVKSFNTGVILFINSIFIIYGIQSKLTYT